MKNLPPGRVSAYLGFDATADSLHVGSLLQIMILRLLQKHNHRPVVLVGGGTTKVGDPSGKDESRQLLDEATIQANIDGISSFDKFIEFGADKAILVNNADWLDSLGYVEFLRTVGAQVTVNRMLSFESVKQRLAAPVLPGSCCSRCPASWSSIVRDMLPLRHRPCFPFGAYGRVHGRSSAERETRHTRRRRPASRAYDFLLEGGRRAPVGRVRPVG